MNDTIVSQIVLVVTTEWTGSYRKAGDNICAVVTTKGEGDAQASAHFVLWNRDGSVFDERPLNQVEVLDGVRALRRTAQDCPDDYVCLNITNGHATLVA